MDDVTPSLTPEIGLFLAHAPLDVRAAWQWLWQFEKRINDGLARVNEPMLKQMRIAWWRDRLNAAATGEAQRDPMAQSFLALTKIHPKLPDLAETLLDQFERELLAGESAEPGPMTISPERAALLAGALVCLIGKHDTAPAQQLGRAWAIAHNRASSEDQISVQAIIHGIDRAALPRALRLMHRHARMCAVGPDGQLRRRDGLLLLLQSLARIV